MRRHLTRFWRDEGGATAIEYGLVAALISVAIIAAVATLGLNLRDKALEVADALLTR